MSWPVAVVLSTFMISVAVIIYGFLKMLGGGWES